MSLSVIVSGVSDIYVTAAEAGPPGPPGPQGPKGDLAGRFLHTQSQDSDTWTVNHNLGYLPNVSVLSLGGLTLWAEIIHTSQNQLLVYFDEPTAGQVVCS